MIPKILTRFFLEIKGIRVNNVDSSTLFVTNQVSFLTVMLLNNLLSPKPSLITGEKSITNSFLSFIFKNKIVYLNQTFNDSNKKSISSKTNHLVFISGPNHLKNQQKIQELCSKANVYRLQSVLIKKSDRGIKPTLKAYFLGDVILGDCSSKHHQIDSLLTDLSCNSCVIRDALILQLIHKIKSRKFFRTIIEDATGAKDSYFSFFFKTILLSETIGKQIGLERRIGVLLPNTNMGAIVFFFCQFLNATPCMLNYSSGFQKLRNCVHISNLRLIVTSRSFVEKADIKEQVAQLENEIQILYLEDIRTKINLTKKIIAMLLLIRFTIAPGSRKRTRVNEEACILFTTGSEGAPKGVILTQANLLSNYRQVQHMLEGKTNDKVLNVLPFFHSFGLMAGLILPVLSGTKSYQYPNPLHVKEIVKICREEEVSILWGTPTFLRNYAEYARRIDFQSLEYVVSGAERLPDEIRELWLKKFGIEILEGYGATEASPVISVNSRFSNKIGTVGRILPLIKYELKSVDGIKGGGELLVKGPNIMKGYIETAQKQAHGEVVPRTNTSQSEKYSSVLQDGWYATGDLVKVDKNRFVTIIGRRKRFAKLGGEMVSLSEVENVAKQIWSASDHAAISINENDNLEKIILFTTKEKPNKKEFIKKAKEKKISNLVIPKKINYINVIPLFGSGKIDYQRLAEIFRQRSKSEGL